MNPGLLALWEDERVRRRRRGLDALPIQPLSQGTPTAQLLPQPHGPVYGLNGAICCMM